MPEIGKILQREAMQKIYTLLASWKTTLSLGMKNYMCCGISSYMMELWPVKLSIHDNVVNALKSLVYYYIISLYALNSEGL